eukprot:UN15495
MMKYTFQIVSFYESFILFVFDFNASLLYLSTLVLRYEAVLVCGFTLMLAKQQGKNLLSVFLA